MSVDHEIRDKWSKTITSSLSINYSKKWIQIYIIWAIFEKWEQPHGCDLSLPCPSKLRHIFWSFTASQRPSITTNGPQMTLLPVLTSELEMKLRRFAQNTLIDEFVINLIAVASCYYWQFRMNHSWFIGIESPESSMSIANTIDQPGGCMANLMN